MTPFVTHEGVAAPLERAQVNTDLIAPARFLKRGRQDGFGDALFADLRGTMDGDRPFVLDRDGMAAASVLVAGENFGCGSSREHAVWALMDFGFRVIVAKSFADIFYNNAAQNGLLAVSLPASDIGALWHACAMNPGLTAKADLPRQEITYADRSARFAIDAYRKDMLRQGLSEIAMTLKDLRAVRDFERGRAEDRPWLSHPKQA